MIEEKEEFFNEIKLIQDLAINIVLSNIETVSYTHLRAHET